LLLLAPFGVLRAQADPTLQAIRDYARHYVASLPNYTARQVIQRTAKVSPAPGIPAQTQTDQLEEQIGYSEGLETHKLLRFNGRVVDSPVRNEGVFSSGEFGGLLETLSREGTGAEFRRAKPQTLRGRRVNVYEFRVPAEPAGYAIKEPGRTTLVAFAGRLYADAQTNTVWRVEMRCVDFPKTLRYKALELTLDYAPAKIAGREYILPARYTLKSRREDAETSIEATFRDYQRFTAEAIILFDEP
jgi:hypothetical protein